jgi:hypothetical protein
MYEARHHTPLSTSSFLQRMVGHGVAAIVLAVFARPWGRRD